MSVPPRNDDKFIHTIAIEPRNSSIAKSIPPRDIASPSNQSSSQYWKKMDDLFFKTMKIAESSYETNRKINLLIVTIGIVLLANSIAYTWYKQSPDAWSIFSGGIGVVSFVTLFFTKPQAAITKALGNLAQIQMIYKMHAIQFEAISNYDYEKYKENGSRDIKEIIEMNKELERATEKSVELTEKYIESNKTENDAERKKNGST